MLLDYGKAQWWGAGRGEEALTDARDAFVAADARAAAVEADIVLAEIVGERGLYEQAEVHLGHAGSLDCLGG